MHLRAARGTRSIHAGEIRGSEGIGEVGDGDRTMKEFGTVTFRLGGFMGGPSKKVERGFVKKEIRRFVHISMDLGKQPMPWVEKESMEHDRPYELIPPDVW